MKNCTTISKNLRKFHRWKFWIFKNYSLKNLGKEVRHSCMNRKNQIISSKCQKIRKSNMPKAKKIISNYSIVQMPKLSYFDTKVPNLT